MTRWDYHVFKFSPAGTLLRGGKIDDRWLSEELNALGKEGWEVTGIITSAIGQGATNEVAVLMKRPNP
jgi:hypothetical protein